MDIAHDVQEKDMGPGSDFMESLFNARVVCYAGPWEDDEHQKDHVNDDSGKGITVVER